MINYNINLVYKILEEFGVPKHIYIFTSDSLQYGEDLPSQLTIDKHIVSLFCGASQICFFCNDLNYVVKIPIYYGEETYTDDDGEEKSELYKYCGALDNNNGSNYCEEAFIRYQQACEYDVNEFFAEIEKVGNWGETPVYVQEKCELFSKRYDESEELFPETKSTHGLTRKEKREIKRLGIRKSQVIEYCTHNKIKVFNWFFQEQLIKQAGASRFLKLMDFIDKFSIDDLHSDNIGYINQKCVLIDYASFED